VVEERSGISSDWKLGTPQIKRLRWQTPSESSDYDNSHKVDHGNNIELLKCQLPEGDEIGGGGGGKKKTGLKDI